MYLYFLSWKTKGTTYLVKCYVPRYPCMEGYEMLQSKISQFKVDMVKLQGKFKECSAVVVEMKQPNCKFIFNNIIPYGHVN